MDKDAITGLVLAGGAGRRMGGADKGLLDWRGRPLVEHVIDRLAPQVGGLMIVANRNREIYECYGHPVVTDELADFQGPLAGLQAGLAACATDWLLCCPCDCPALPADLAGRLFAAAEASGANLAVACSPAGLQPTFQLCRRELLPELARYLAGGGRKVREWCAGQGAAVAPFPDDTPFANFNDPESLAARSAA